MLCAMTKPFFAFLLATAILPFATATTLAQTPPEGPPPAVRAQMQQLHDSAKTNAFNALSADHRARVQAILDQVNAGSLDRRAAATQIDAILSPGESQAVLNEQKKMRDAMRAYFAQNPPPGGTGQRAERGGPGGPGNGQRTHTPDAGRTLVMLGTNRPQRPPGQP